MVAGLYGKYLGNVDMNVVFWCKNCLNMSTRPRINFDERGWCNACQWMEEKKTLDWSGGKDGSYVSYKLKHAYGLNILAITVTPALSLELGNKNLRNYVDSGYNHIQVNSDVGSMRILNRTGFIEKGFPYYGWLVSIQAAVVRMAVNLNIPLIFYGEDGEIEYGGSTETKNKALYDVEYMKRVYFEGGYEHVLDRIKKDEEINESDLL